jgi:sortase A
MPDSDDTLDIEPILPPGATSWAPDISFGDGVLNPGGDNNPEAAHHARTKIAALHHTQHSDTMPIPEVPFKPARQAAEPVSPAHQTHAAEHPRQKLKRHIHKFRPIINGIASFLLLVLIFKAPVFYSQFKFLTTKPSAQPPAISAVTADAPVTVSGGPEVIIPKINVNVPLVFEPSVDNTAVETALENGVVHYGITANPGEVGNTVIVGHSSNDWWQPGNYKFAFVLLDKLAAGDTVLVNYQGIQYRYQVTGKRIVEASDVSVLNPTSTPTITLLTCWPAGTNLKREIVTAQQVSPVPGANGALKIAKTPDTSSLTLPNDTPGFAQEVSDFFHAITSAFSHKPTDVQLNQTTPATTPSSTTPASQSTGGALPGN